MLNLTRVISLLICTTFSLPAFSQIDFKHFPIDSFKLPDIEWKALIAGGSLSGNYDHRHERELDRQFNSSNLNSNLLMQYSGYINRPDVQTFYSLGINPDFHLRHNDRDSINYSYTDRQVNPQINGSWTRRKYNGRNFFQLGIQPYFTYYNNVEIETDGATTTKTKQSDQYHTVNIPIGIGKGRIELVSDVAMALFLLKDAVNIGLDSNLIHEQDVLDFASLMAEVRNKRVFDSRRKRIDELRHLYDFMLEKNWVLKDDPGFFTVLTDNWIYNFNYSRYSGNRWTYLLTPLISFRSNREHETGQQTIKSNNQTYGTSASIEYEHDRPRNLNMNFRRTHLLQISYYNDVSKFNNQQTTNKRLQGLFSNSIGYSWYPNNRTQIFTDINASYRYYKNLNVPGSLIDSRDNHDVDLSISGQCRYFVSYQTIFSLFASIGYNYTTRANLLSNGGTFYLLNNGSDGLRATLNASITISIF